MSRTYRDPRAFRTNRSRIEAPIASADFLVFGANGRPYAKHGEEAWKRGSKKYAKRQARRTRRRLPIEVE